MTARLIAFLKWKNKVFWRGGEPLAGDKFRKLARLEYQVTEPVPCGSMAATLFMFFNFIVMRKMNLLFFVLLGFLFLTTPACDKDKLDETVQVLGNAEIDVPDTNVPAEQVKQKLGIYLAKTCNEDVSFKRLLFEAIVNVNTGESNELFVLDFLNRRHENGTVKDAIVRANNLEQAAFADLFNQIDQHFYTLVVDVPDYITWFFHPVYGGGGDIKSTYIESPFVFYPDIKKRNKNGKWVGFGQQNEEHSDFSKEWGVVLHQIGPKESYSDVIPLFVKFAELNYLFNTNSRSGNKDEFIQKYYGDVIEEGKDCIGAAIDQAMEPITLGTSQYNVVQVMSVKELSEDCNKQLPPIVVTTPPNTPPGGFDEICGNGIDDDGDGLVDEEDCTSPYETDCGNGVDDDGDGLVDAADPDCTCDCERDCQQDHNYLLKHTFKRVLSYYTVTSEQIPGVEKIIDLRYDITRLNAPSCPPNGPCPFTTNHKIVFDRATMLTCSQYTQYLTPQVVNTLCMGYTVADEVAWSQRSTGFFYGHVSSGPYVGGGENIYFGTVNGLYAHIIGTNGWVVEPTHYLPGAGDGNWPDWDASIYGDMIRINISEVDNDQISSGQTTTQSYTISTEFQSKVGFKVAVPEVGEVNGENSFKFGASITRSVENTFMVQASNLVRLGDLDLVYCDNQDYTWSGNPYDNRIPGPQGFNTIKERNAVLEWWDLIVLNQ